MYNIARWGYKVNSHQSTVLRFEGFGFWIRSVESEGMGRYGIGRYKNQFTHQNRKNRKKLRCPYISRVEIFLRAITIEFTVFGFGRERPRRFVSAQDVYATQEDRVKSKDTNGE